VGADFGDILELGLLEKKMKLEILKANYELVHRGEITDKDIVTFGEGVRVKSVEKIGEGVRVKLGVGQDYRVIEGKQFRVELKGGK